MTLNYFNLTTTEIEYFYKLFSNCLKIAGWELRIDTKSLEYVDGWLSNAHDRLKNQEDFLVDLSRFGGEGELPYSNFIISGAGSFLAKLWLKEFGGEISTSENYGEFKTATVIKYKSDEISPWAWAAKQLQYGNIDSVWAKFEALREESKE